MQGEIKTRDRKLKSLKEKEININRVVNRYVRMKRNKFIKKYIFLGLLKNTYSQNP
jgi:hypothetical protein